MANIESWVPTIISTGALGIIWFNIRNSTGRLHKKIDKAADKQDEFLKKTEHAPLCENQSLKFKLHVTKEITRLKDEIFDGLRDIKTAVENGNKK